MIETFDIIEWLENDMLHPYPSDENATVNPAEINNVLYFALVWNAFEDVLVGAKAAAEQGGSSQPASLKIIRQAIEDLQRQRLLINDDFTWFLDEFRKRYLDTDGELKNFNFNFMPTESEERAERNLKAVIRGSETRSAEIVYALITITWRLRNNLFHGIKFVFELPEQNENFGVVNGLLAKFTRILKNSDWIAPAFRPAPGVPAVSPTN